MLAVQAQTPTHKHYSEAGSFDTPSPTGAVAPRLQNVGKHAFKVTTKSEQAQRFINQGLNLTYGFNHAEAGRAFAEAARLDPDLAMAHWGQALVLGPNINAPMAPEEEPKALEHLRKAQALKAKASQRERDYIDALAMRYTGKADDRAAADQAFAGAMRVLHEKYPDDQDAATLYAESLMDLSPWNYWTRDGRPYERTHDIIASLDKVLKSNPDHPGALHLWIHLWEASNTPEKAEAAADRSAAARARSRASRAHARPHLSARRPLYGRSESESARDRRRRGLHHAVPRAGSVSARVLPAQRALPVVRRDDGRAESARDRRCEEDGERHPGTGAEGSADPAGVRADAGLRAGALRQVGRDSVRRRRRAPTRCSRAAVRHYARGMAFIRKKDFPAAQKEIEAVRKIASDPKLIETPSSMSLNLADAVLRVAVEVLDGEYAAARGDYDKAIAHLDRAVRYQDALIYTEPDDWHQPVRHNLGAVLLQAGRPVEAESVYWDDLRMHPKNGWALYGLAEALRAQGKNDQAKLVEADFKTAWKDADIQLTASRF